MNGLEHAIGQDNWRAAIPCRSANSAKQKEGNVREEIGGLDKASRATFFCLAMRWISAMKSATGGDIGGLSMDQSQVLEPHQRLMICVDCEGPALQDNQKW
jgi:hypothetical protein